MQLIVVGAGAAGLWAAAAAARRGLEVVLLEKTRRTGTKVLASGGTRCNLTTTLDPRAAAATFGHEGARFLAPALRVLPPGAVREHFHRLGVPTKVEAELDKVFPASDRARDVRDALLRDAEQAGVRIVLGSAVTGVRPVAEGWEVQATTGTWTAPSLFLCPGGRSYPRSGTTGDGYGWLRSLELQVVEPVPALVPLHSPASWVHGLSGVAIDATVRAGSLRRRRPVLFTHKGLSGPGAMDVSEAVSRGVGEVRLDLLPDTSWDDVRTLLIEAGGRRGNPRLSSVLPLPSRVVAMLLGRVGLPDDARAQVLSKKRRHQLVDVLKNLVVPVSGTAGWDKAEVTAGGLALTELDRRTMQVSRHRGLFVFGEILDLTGPIGGLNFLSAFATAELAARAVSESR